MCQSENIYSDKHKKHCTPWVFMLSRVVYTSTCLYLSIRLVFNVYRPTVFSGSRACSATLFAVSRWKSACSRTENYGEQCKDEGFLKIPLGVFIVFVKAHLDILSLHFPDEPYYRPPLSPPKNPIKREKKKLAYSSEREDFIQRGEDWFVCLLKVLWSAGINLCSSVICGRIIICGDDIL